MPPQALPAAVPVLVMQTPSVPVLRAQASAMLAARRAIDRRTVAYTPALTVIGLLLQSKGITLEGRPATLPLPGFLFDMNRFFQALI